MVNSNDLLGSFKKKCHILFLFNISYGFDILTSETFSYFLIIDFQASKSKGGKKLIFKDIKAPKIT